MRATRSSLLVALAISILLGAVLASPAAAQRTVYKGQFQCNDREVVSPLAGMAVELWKRGDSFWPVEWVGSRVDQGFTDSEGRFRMRTPPDEDNYFVRMALRDAHGVHLRDFWGINDWSVDTEQKRNNVATRDYGSMVFTTPAQSHKCAIWSGVHKANEEFRAETGTELPTRGVEIQADAVTAGTPFTPGTSILWPGGYSVGPSAGDDSTTRHEYAHVMRHGMDGDFGHFVGDAATFNYAQHHEACGRTNEGFAFNEGWAEFWAQRFWPAPDCGSPNDMSFEGNVAAALTELMENCAGGQRKVMVENLRRNPLRIHSFAEFRDLLGCPIPRPVPVLVIAATAEAAPPPAPPRVRAGAALREVKSASKHIGRLEKTLTAALRKAQNPPSCDKEPCMATLQALTRPAAIKFEIQMAKIQRGAAAPLDSPKEQGRLASQSFRKLLADQGKDRAKLRKKVVGAALARVKEAMKAAQPVFKADSSKLTKRLRRELSEAAASFRRAKSKGATVLPGPLTLTPQSFQRPRKRPPGAPTPPRPLPGPTIQPIQPSVQPDLATTLILECPAHVVEAPKPIEVSGTLAPAPPGSTVAVTFSHPAANPVSVVAPVDANGNWAASHLPGPNDTGTWTVNASYAGAPMHLPSASPACQVTYQ
jgi:hypothetical protein